MAGALEASLSELLGFSIFEGLSKEREWGLPQIYEREFD